MTECRESTASLGGDAEPDRGRFALDFDEPQPHCKSLRAEISGGHHRRDLARVEGVEREVEEGAARLGRKTVARVGGREHPSDLSRDLSRVRGTEVERYVTDEVVVVLDGKRQEVAGLKKASMTRAVPEVVQ